MLANHIILGMIGGYQLAIIVAILWREENPRANAWIRRWNP